MISDLGRIRTFMEIVKVRSFSKASKSLGLSQPAVTLQMKKLESDLQATLIYRKKNGILLTSEGEKFYKLCLRFEETIFKFERDAIHIKDESAPVKIAANLFVGNVILPTLLDKIATITKSEIDVVITDYNDLATCLLAKRCDFAFVSDKICNDRLHLKKVLQYDVVLASNKPFSGSIGLNKLQDLTFVKDGSKGFFDLYFDKFGIKYDEFKVAFRVFGPVALKTALLNNKSKQYVALLPKFMIEKELENGALFLVPVDGLKIKRELFVAGLSENKAAIDQIGNIEVIC